jgi:hypothetical protein
LAVSILSRKKEAHQFLQSMRLDVTENITILDSLMQSNKVIIANHDSLVNWLLADSATIDRAHFQKKWAPYGLEIS